MKIKNAWLAVLGAASALTAAHAQEVAQADLKAVEERGRQIYVHDYASAVVSDAVVPLITPTARNHIRGYVTEEKGGTIVVTFYGTGEDERLYAWYRAAVGPDGRMLGTVSQYEVPQALSEYEEHAAAARQVSKQFEMRRCAQNYNTVVLPKPDGWQVYLLPGTKDNGVMPVGGAYRLDTDASGRTITTDRAYSKSCISLQKMPNSEAAMLTHLLDPQPTELHVFWQLLSRHPLFLFTTQNSLLWPIEKGHINPAQKIEGNK